MKECIAITTYCNTKEKINALNRTIDNIKQYGLPIFIHAHYPLNDEIQKKVHSYHYSSDNPISGRYNVFWYYTENYKLELTAHEITYTVLKAWDESIKICSAENIRIKYISYNGNKRTYSPDYIVNDVFLTEIKPKRLQSTPLNKLKFECGIKYCDENGLKFKVKDFGIIFQNQLDELITNNLVKLH